MRRSLLGRPAPREWAGLRPGSQILFRSAPPFARAAKPAEEQSWPFAPPGSPDAESAATPLPAAWFARRDTLAPEGWRRCRRTGFRSVLTESGSSARTVQPPATRVVRRAAELNRPFEHTVRLPAPRLKGRDVAKTGFRH